MGVVSRKDLYHILYAAATYSESRDPAAEINNYLIANNLLTHNIRADSGQPDAWRDYQQILSELGLIFSTKILRRITPTPLGLAFLDGSLGFSEVITLQALRFQYPNGHHLRISTSLREALARSGLANPGKYAALQQLSGVKLRPGVLVWRVLRGLQDRGLEPELHVDEIECYLMRSATHDDTEPCLDTLSTARRSGPTLAPLGGRARRNAQDWVKFLGRTPLFDPVHGGAAIRLTTFAAIHANEIDGLCAALERPEAFWQPTSLDRTDRLTWYSYFGAIDLALPSFPSHEETEISDEYVGGAEEEEPSELGVSADAGAISLRPFDLGVAEGETRPPTRPGAPIESVYSADLAGRAHRLHDQMVRLIAHVCKGKGADVYEDPGSVDLLVQFRETEFIIEAKSVTAKNFITRIRYALGQVLHYDYLRSAQSGLPRRKVLAFAAQLPPQLWAIPFLNTHLDTDVLSLEAGLLKANSPSSLSRELFS